MSLAKSMTADALFQSKYGMGLVFKFYAVHRINECGTSILCGTALEGLSRLGMYYWV